MDLEKWFFFVEFMNHKWFIANIDKTLYLKRESKKILFFLDIQESSRILVALDKLECLTA